MVVALAAGLALVVGGCTGRIGESDPERGDPHPLPEGDVTLPPEPMDPDLGALLAAPPSGWTELDLDYKVQNWTEAPIGQRFTARDGQFRTEVRAGESRVEMRWEDWPDQGKEHMFTADVRIERGSTRTAIMQIKSNEDGEPIYIQIFNTSGDLRNNGDGTSIARGMYERWFNLKAAFNPRTGLARAWIDDTLVKTRQYRTGTSGWYFKNGTYNNGLPEGGRSIAHFRNIHIYRNDGGGRAPAPPAAPPTPTPTPTPPATGDTIALEAEDLPVTHSGTGTSIQMDDQTSGGRWLSLDAENAGSWLELTTPRLRAGRYQLEVQWKAHSTRGVASFRVDDTDLGEPLDQYSSEPGYPTAAIGTVTFDGEDTHLIRVRVTGKNERASGYILSVDRLIFRR